MIKSKFLRPLSAAGILKDEEKKCIFFGIEVKFGHLFMYEFFKQELIWTILLKKLHEIHTGLHSDLIKAHNNINGQKLYTVFLNWKKKLLIYGSICSNLSNARRAVKSALCRSKNVADEIEVWRLFLSIASFSYWPSLLQSLYLCFPE